LAKRGFSCFKGLLWGCGCLTALFILLGVASFVMVQSAKLDPPEIAALDEEQEFESSELQGLHLPELPEEARPVRVELEVRTASLQVVPDGENGKIRIDGEYDKANYELVSSIQDEGDQLVYRIEFRRIGGSSLSFFMGEKNPDNNRLTLHLPRDLALGLVLDHNIGELDLDLTGVPLYEIDLEASMGEGELRMARPNPIPMQRFNVDASMGEFGFEDLQNYRFQTGRVHLSMGAAEMGFSGSMSEPMRIDFDASMCETVLVVPSSARLDCDLKVSMGEYRGPRRSPADQDEQAPVLKIRGSVSMGEFDLKVRDM